MHQNRYFYTKCFTESVTQFSYSNSITEPRQVSINHPVQMAAVCVRHVSATENAVSCVKDDISPNKLWSAKRESC